MTTKEYIRTLEKRYAKIKAGKALGVAVQDTIGKQGDRIFIDGEASDGGLIGAYEDSTPIYVAPSAAPKGNGGKFPSYKAFRVAMGRESNFVNLRLSGDMQKDFLSSIKRVTGVKWQRVFKNKIHSKIMEGQEERFDKDINKATDEEREFFKKRASQVITKTLQGG